MREWGLKADRCCPGIVNEVASAASAIPHLSVAVPQLPRVQAEEAQG